MRKHAERAMGQRDTWSHHGEVSKLDGAWRARSHYQDEDNVARAAMWKVKLAVTRPAVTEQRYRYVAYTADKKMPQGSFEGTWTMMGYGGTMKYLAPDGKPRLLHGFAVRSWGEPSWFQPVLLPWTYVERRKVEDRRDGCVRQNFMTKSNPLGQEHRRRDRRQHLDTRGFREPKNQEQADRWP